MVNQLVQPGRKLVRFQFLLSLIITFVITFVTYLYWDVIHAQSAFCGGFISIIPNAVFAYKAFKYAGASSSKKVMESFFMGEKLKLGLTALLFALSFKFLPVAPVPLFGTFFVVMMMSLLTPVLFKL